MPNIIGQNDEIFRRVQQPSRNEQDAREVRTEESIPRTARSMENKNGIVYASVSIAMRLTEDPKMQTQFWQD